jgi:Mg-chelatase subunit ChlD
MKTKIIALSLFVFTAAAVAFYPDIRNAGASNIQPVVPAIVNPIPDQRAKIDVVFVLDTTGSMSGLIHAAKEKIWSIASTMASAQSAPEIRIGLVAYRDRGDAYVTRVLDLSGDLDSMYAALMDFQADGGGDGPESVNQALHDAVHKVSWSKDQNTYKVIFLVGDAPPHMDYQDDVKYPRTLSIAKQQEIVVNTIQCGSDHNTTGRWQQIAHLGQGRFFQVDQAGSAVAIATPYDEALAGLSRELDETRLYYGRGEEKRRQQAKIAATEKLHDSSSVESRARRATYNATASGKSNLFGEKELVEDVVSGRIEVSSIQPAELPKSMQAMSPEERKDVIKKTAKQREDLQRQIDELADKRSAYLKNKVEEGGGADDSLDEKIYSAVREQAASKGILYGDEAAAY